MLQKYTVVDFKYHVFMNVQLSLYTHIYIHIPIFFKIDPYLWNWKVGSVYIHSPEGFFEPVATAGTQGQGGNWKSKLSLYSSNMVTGTQVKYWIASPVFDILILYSPYFFHLFITLYKSLLPKGKRRSIRFPGQGWDQFLVFHKLYEWRPLLFVAKSFFH